MPQESVATLVAIARTRKVNVSHAAIRALGHCAPQEALPALVELLGERWARGDVAKALATIGDEAAIPSLCVALRELVGDDPLPTIRERMSRCETLDSHDAIDVGRALAWLGDERFVGPLLELASLEGGFEDALRDDAVHALSSVRPTPSLIRALLAGQRSASREVAETSMSILASVGLIGCVPHWIALLESGPGDREDLIGRALREVFGPRAPNHLFELIVDEPPEPEALWSWWGQISGELSADACLWQGLPSSPAVAIERLHQNGTARDQLLRWTGVAFVAADRPTGGDVHEVARARAWWLEHGATWVPGELRHRGRLVAKGPLLEALADAA